MMEFGCYDDMIRFKRMLQNTQTPVSEDRYYLCWGLWSLSLKRRRIDVECA